MDKFFDLDSDDEIDPKFKNQYECDVVLKKRDLINLVNKLEYGNQDAQIIN